MKWKDIPEDFKDLIKKQYDEYCQISQDKGQKPLSWEDWLKRQGHIIEENERR